MQILLIILLSFYTNIYANIIKYDTNNTKDTTHIILYFDTLKNQTISTTKTNDTNIITINDKIKFKNNNFKNKLLGKVKFVSLDNTTNILFKNKSTFDISHIKSDKKLIIKIKQNNLLLIKSNDKIKLKQSSISYTDYLTSFLIVVFLILIYFFLKIKILKIPTSIKNTNYKLLFQKSLDMKTKISMIEIEDKRYLVLTGNNHSLLLDKFDNNKEKFEDIMKDITN
jgi:flagellar biogenesis protein FliO